MKTDGFRNFHAAGSKEEKIVIEISHLVKKYGDHIAVNDLTLTVEPGKIYGFLGPNGAGKSTTMNIITGYLGATSGEVKINGFDIFAQPEEAKKCVGYLPEIPPLYVDMTVREYLNFVAELKKLEKGRRNKYVEEAMVTTGITAQQSRLIRNLSKGYRQRVGFAQAVLGYPEIIILDEPTVGLDPKQIIEIRELIRELAKEHTVILSSHILAEIQEVCDYIMIISKGKLVASDTPENLEKLLTNQQTVEILAKGNEDTVRKVIGTIGNVQKASVEHGKEEGTVKASLFPKDGKDIRETVFKAFAQEGCPLLMLYHSRTTLEDVFLELTQGSTPAAAKAMKDGEKKDWMVKRRKKNAQEEAEENELTEMDEEPEENAVPTSEDEKEDLENDSNL